MTAQNTLERVKLALRRTHSALDEDLQADIDACLTDLVVHGISEPDETDPLIYNAIKLFCLSSNTDDTVKSSEYKSRYEALRASLGSAEGYGYEEAANNG